jgi:hypothetical protein
VCGRPPRDLLPVEAHGAVPRRDDPEDRLQRRRLPGRVATEQADELPLADDEVDSLEDVDLAVEGIDGLELEERRSRVHFVDAAFVPR